MLLVGGEGEASEEGGEAAAAADAASASFVIQDASQARELASRAHAAASAVDAAAQALASARADEAAAWLPRSFAARAILPSGPRLATDVALKGNTRYMQIGCGGGERWWRWGQGRRR